MQMPGDAFDISDPANVKPLLGHVRHLIGISTYGRQRWVAMYVGDPPRRSVTRHLPRLMHKRVKVAYHALYHMNVATDADRRGFMGRVRKAMAAVR